MKNRALLSVILLLSIALRAGEPWKLQLTNKEEQVDLKLDLRGEHRRTWNGTIWPYERISGGKGCVWYMDGDFVPDQEQQGGYPAPVERPGKRDASYPANVTERFHLPHGTAERRGREEGGEQETREDSGEDHLTC